MLNRLILHRLFPVLALQNSQSTGSLRIKKSALITNVKMLHMVGLFNTHNPLYYLHPPPLPPSPTSFPSFLPPPFPLSSSLLLSLLLFPTFSLPSSFPFLLPTYPPPFPLPPPSSFPSSSPPSSSPPSSSSPSSSPPSSSSPSSSPPPPFPMPSTSTYLCPSSIAMSRAFLPVESRMEMSAWYDINNFIMSTWPSLAARWRGVTWRKKTKTKLD